MPSVITHPAVPLAFGLGLGARVIPKRLLLAGVVASAVPDIDVYIHPFWSAIAHRGVTHTLAASLLAGICATLIARALHATHAKAFWFVFLSMLSHPLLDMFTNGGAGIPIFWPVSFERYFWPWTPIEVSPLGLTSFFSERGVEVLESELVWVWAPFFFTYVLLRIVKAKRQTRSATYRRH